MHSPAHCTVNTAYRFMENMGMTNSCTFYSEISVFFCTLNFQIQKQITFLFLQPLPPTPSILECFVLRVVFHENKLSPFK